MEVNRASSGLPAEKGQHGGKKIGGEAAAAAAPCGGSAGKDGVLPLDFEGIHRERGQKKTRPSNGTGEKERNVWGLLILNPCETSELPMHPHKSDGNKSFRTVGIRVQKRPPG